MGYLVDTSVLVRLANVNDAWHAAAAAVVELHRRKESLHLTAQNLIEFRNAATRSLGANGLGLTTAECEFHAATFERTLLWLPETPGIYPAWKSLVESLGVIGKQVHDARLVAVCHVHRVTHLLTFNTGHFARLATFGPGITVVDPAAV